MRVATVFCYDSDQLLFYHRSMEKGIPNLAQGIIYQKLQMLNCCIEKKIGRERDQAKTNSSEPETVSFNQDDDSNSSDSRPNSANKRDSSGTQDKERLTTEQSDSDDIDDDDEFFECDSEADGSKADQSESVDGVKSSKEKSDSENTEKDASKPDDITQRLGSNTSSKSIYEDSVERQPKGRLSKLDDLKLINGLDDLYVPVTQEPAPMTEDLLAEHAEVLTR